MSAGPSGTDVRPDPPEDRPRRTRIVLGGVAVVLALAVLAIATLTGGGNEPDGGAPPSAGSVEQERQQVPRRDAGDPLALGRVDAPVVVSEWADFQCPFCRLYESTTAPAVLRQYVDSGQVRIEFHDFAYLGPESVVAARAARAAGRQGKFWEFHDALYRDQPPENRGVVTDDRMVGLAGTLGLDVDRFRADFADPAIARAVADDQALGSRLGVGGVPSFVIGDRLIFGAQPLPVFQQAIDAELARAR